MTIETIYSIATRPGSHGLGLVSYQAIRALGEAGMLKRAVTYRNRSDLPKEKLLALPGNPAKLLFFLSKDRYRYMRKDFLDFVTARVIRKSGCTVFHGWNTQALRSIRAAKKQGAKVILECGSTYTPYKEDLLTSEYRAFGAEFPVMEPKRRESALAEFDEADYIFVPSEFARKTFIDAGFDPGRVFVVPRAVDMSRFSPATRPPEQFTVLFMGKLSIRKGLHYLLEAWRELDLRDGRLVLVGNPDGTMEPLLKTYRSMENIEFAGHTKDPAASFRRASCFVFPSLEEGSAKVNYEAMATGLPVITTPNSGPVIKDGEDGFIIPIRDKESIKERILYCRDNPQEARQVGMRAAESVRQYTWENYRSTLTGIYRRLFGG
jgi:glycosyltransferase involved in cell wall biosynthesis